MKAIVILFDSLNRHFLSMYGNDWVKTPNLDAFARSSIIFDNHYLGSAPCMPARRDMLTGRLGFLERGWGGLEPFDLALPEVLAGQGVHSHMETDHAHYLNGGGEFYHTCFTTWQVHRGQENDPLPGSLHQIAQPAHDGHWHAQNISNRRIWEAHEERMPTPRTFQGAIDWLSVNRKMDDYLLWVEAFDPHEPFEVPEAYLRRYEDSYRGPWYDWSGYERVERDDPSTIHLRNRYAATLTMADHWFGRLLETLKAQGGLDDTLLILTSDHGHLLGEHGCTGKNHWHVWQELAHIPLMVRLPGGRLGGERRSALTQNIDLMPTLLDFFNVSPPERALHGESLWPVIEHDAKTRREGALYGWFGKTVNVTDGRYTYMRAPADRSNTPLHAHWLMPTRYHRRFTPEDFAEAEFGPFLPWTDCPVLRAPAETEFGMDDELFTTRLHDLSKDPNQERNLAGQAPEQQYADLLRRCMVRCDAPKEQYVRLGL